MPRCPRCPIDDRQLETCWGLTHYIPGKLIHSAVFPARIWKKHPTEETFTPEFIRLIIHECIHRIIFRQGIKPGYNHEFVLWAMGLV